MNSPDKKNPDVSIIIPVHNREELLGQCIDQIKQTASGSYEIIVVDDHSQPPVAVSEPNVKTIFLEQNSGPAAARNQGAALAYGDILFFIDSDIMLTAAAYRAMMETLKQNKYGAVQGMFSPDIPCRNFCSRYKNYYWSYNQQQMDPHSYSLCTALFAIKKDVFTDAGRFNESSLIGEDREMGFTLQQKKIKILQIKDAKGIHCKNFNFHQLILYHFQSAVATALFLLQIRNEPVQDRTAGGGWRQTAGIILSPVFIISIAGAFISLEKFFILAAGLFLFYIWITAGFVRFCQKQEGSLFAAAAFLMYVVEEATAFLGLCWGFLRHYIFQKKQLDFRFGKGL
ncbi:MAG: glycosyltransferase family 2 protein [Candidatus Omnitrophota bacterium]